MTSKIYEGRVVLVTGGTRGIGLGTALVFARHGAQAVLTHAWGSADEDEVRARFRAVSAPEPVIVQADVARSEDTGALFALIKERCGRLDAFVSNASVAQLVRGLDDLGERAFLKTLRASAWPTVEYVLTARRMLGRFPRYVVALSSDGPDHYTPGYDFVAASKASLESLVRYLAYRLKDDGVRVNVLRSRAIRTDSFTETFGGEFHAFLRGLVPEGWFMTVEELAEAAFALCSGMFDGMSGEVLMVDRGNTFMDGISYVYERATR